MNHVIALKELIGGEMNENRGFTHAFSCGDNAQISFSEPAVSRFFQNADRAPLYKFLYDHFSTSTRY